MFMRANFLSSIRKMPAVLILCSLLIAGLAACGSNASSAHVTMQILVPLADTQGAAIKTVIQSYEKANPNVTIQLRENSDSFSDILNAGLTSGTAPDIWMNNFSGGPLLKDPNIAAGYVEDLSNQPWVSRLTPGVKSAVTYQDGKIYYQPINVNAIGVIYDKQVFAAQGITIPQTWADFLQVCQKLKAAGITPLGYGGKTQWANFPLPYAMVANTIAKTDPTFDKDLYSGTATFANSPWLQTIKDIANLNTQGYFNQSPAGTDWPTSAQLLSVGKVAMLVQGDWAPSVIRTTGSADLGMFALPYNVAQGAQPTLTANVNRTWAVYAKGKHVSEALKFVAYFSQPTNVAPNVEINGGLATYSDVQVKVDPAETTLSPLISSAVPFANNNWPNGVWQAMNDGIAGVLAGAKTPDQVVKDMDAAFQANKNK